MMMLSRPCSTRVAVPAATKRIAGTRVTGIRSRQLVCKPVAFRDDDNGTKPDYAEASKPKTVKLAEKAAEGTRDVLEGYSEESHDPTAPYVNPLEPAFTRRREAYMSRIAMLGFFAGLVGECYTGAGPIGQIHLATGLPYGAVVSGLWFIVSYTAIGALSPASATFSPENQRDVAKRPPGPPGVFVNPITNPMKFLGITGWGFTKENEIFNGRAAMIGFLAAVIGELQTGMGPIARLYQNAWGVPVDYGDALRQIWLYSGVALGLALVQSFNIGPSKRNYDIY